MNSSINNMISHLACTRENMLSQCETIGEIMEKSNNVLLQVESTHSLTSLSGGQANGQEELGVPCIYKKAIKQAMANVLIKGQTTLKNSDAVAKQSDSPNNIIEQYLQSNRVRVEHLGRTIRKIIAIRDTVAHLKAGLQEQDDDEDGDEEQSEDEVPYESSPDPQ